MTDAQFIASVKPSLAKCIARGEYKDIKVAHAAIKKLILHGGYPDTLFTNFRGAGSYKEAWQVGSLCIKFAEGGSAIRTEIDTYNRAAEYNIQHFFCPSYFHELPADSMILCSEMDEEPLPCDDPRYNPEDPDAKDAPRAAYLVIQPCAGLVDGLTVYDNPYDYEEHPLILNDGSALSGYEYMCMDAPYEWRESVIQQYGDAGYRDLAWGLRRLGVEDLHVGNVGWLGEKPVILDWLSYTAPLVRPS